MRERDTLKPAPPPDPLLLPALAFCAAIAVADFNPARAPLLQTVAIATAIILWVAGRISGTTAATRWAAAGAGAALAFAVGAWRYQGVAQPLANCVSRWVSPEGALARVRGTVIDGPHFQPPERRNPFLPFEPQPRVRFVLDATALENGPAPEPISGRIQVSVQAAKLDIAPGMEVRCAGRLYALRRPQNPGSIDWGRMARLDGLAAGLFVEDADLLAPLSPPAGRWSWIAFGRTWARRALLESYFYPDDDEERGLLDAMILGQRDAVSRSLNEAFIRTGTIHVLSVSGFHFALLAGSVYWLARRLRASVRAAALITLPVILLFTVVAEPNAPLLRSAVLSTLICTSQLLRRRTSPLNWLAFGALVLLAWNPLSLFQPGFQLSFVQVAGLILAVPLIQPWTARRDPWRIQRDVHSWPQLFLRRLGRWAMIGLLIAAVLWITSLPLVIFHFGRFSPWAVPETLLLTPLVELVTLTGFATELAGLVFAPLGAALGLGLAWATRLLVWAEHALASLPGSQVELHGPPTALVVFTYVLLLALALSWRAAPRMAVGARRMGLASSYAGGAALLMLWLGWILFRRLDPCRKRPFWPWATAAPQSCRPRTAPSRCLTWVPTSTRRRPAR